MLPTNTAVSIPLSLASAGGAASGRNTLLTIAGQKIKKKPGATIIKIGFSIFS